MGSEPLWACVCSVSDPQDAIKELLNCVHESLKKECGPMLTAAGSMHVPSGFRNKSRKSLSTPPGLECVCSGGSGGCRRDLQCPRLRCGELNCDRKNHWLQWGHEIISRGSYAHPFQQYRQPSFNGATRMNLVDTGYWKRIS